MPALIRAFEADDGQLLTTYIDSLGMIGGKDALMTVAGALVHQEQRVRAKALSSLKSSTGMDFGEDLQAWLRHLEGH